MFLLLVGWSWIHRPIIQADSQNQQSSSQALFPSWTYILESQGFKHSLTKVDEESRWREAAKEMETKVSIILHVLCLYLTIQIKNGHTHKKDERPIPQCDLRGQGLILTFHCRSCCILAAVGLDLEDDSQKMTSNHEHERFPWKYGTLVFPVGHYHSSLQHNCILMYCHIWVIKTQTDLAVLKVQLPFWIFLDTNTDDLLAVLTLTTLNEHYCSVPDICFKVEQNVP